MRKVFVIQKQMRFDEKLNELVPKFDIGAALQYGEIEYILSPTASPFHPDTIIPELEKKVEKIKKGDYLLLLGNPCLIGVVSAFVAKQNKQLNLLQWSGREQRYIPVLYDNLF